jgi:hypothetical protein
VPKSNINQIKGKGNRAPNPEYLPYVQDFVRSGDWGDEIGDLHYTGLKRLDDAFSDYEMKKYFNKVNPDQRYLTQQEIDDFTKEWNTPPEGQKHGGEIKMGVGGLLKNAIKGAKTIQKIEAPSVIIPSKINNIKKAVLKSKGDYGARRVERAADEIPNLDKLYKEEALKQAFLGDNAKAMMTMNPEDFEKYAAPLEPRFMDANSTRYTTSGEQLTYPEYMSEYLPNVGAFNDLPFLEINKKIQGLSIPPFISGHEGRHRNRTLAAKGENTGLVQLLPRAELREPFPRHSQEEYIEALKKELEMTNNVVEPQAYWNPDVLSSTPQIKRPAIKLPDIYAKGGAISIPKFTPKMGVGGLLKNAALIAAREEALAKFPQFRKEIAARQAIEAEYKKAMRNVPYDEHITLKEWEATQTPPAPESSNVINLNIPKAKGGAVRSLESNLFKLPKTDYDSIDELMTEISKLHKTVPKKLHDEFVAKHHMTPDTWIKRK